MLPARSAFSSLVPRPALAAATLQRQPPLSLSIRYTTRFLKPPTVNTTLSAFSIRRQKSATASALPATSLVKTFDSAAKDGDTALLQSTYRAILADPEASQFISRVSFKNALFALQNSKVRSDFDFMNRLFVDMQEEFNIKPLAMEYTCLINAHGLHGRPAQALHLLSVMRNNDVSPTLHTYNILISALKRCKDVEGAADVYRDMIDHGIEPDKVTYNMMIDLYFKHNQITQAYKLYTEMILAGHEADNFTYATLLTAATRFGNVAIGAKVRDDLLVGHQRQSIDIVTVNALLSFVSSCVGDAGETLRIYRDIPLLFPSAHPDIVTYNTMLDTCLKFGQVASAHAVFRDMADAGIAPDIVTYGIMISAQARQGDAAAAARLYDDMRQAGMWPDERILVGLVNAMVAAGQVEAVPALVRKMMAEDGVGADLGVWKAVLDGLAKLGDAAGAQSLFDEVFVEEVEGKRKEEKADISVYTNLVVAHINAGNVDRAMDIYYSLKERQELRSSSPPPPRFDTTFYTAVISALTNQSTSTSSSLLKVALSLFSDMRALQIHPNAYTYTTLLTAVARDPSGSNLKLLEQIHGLIKMDLYLDPDAAIYNALMDGYARAGDITSVLRIWDTLTQALGGDIAPSGADPAAGWGLIDHATVSIVLDACGHNRAGYRAREIWMWLAAREFPVNTNNWCSYVECVLRTAEKGKKGWEEGFAVVKKMGRGARERIEVDEKTVRTLLAFAKKGKVEEYAIRRIREWITHELAGRKNLLEIVAEEAGEHKEKKPASNDVTDVI